MSGTGRSTEGSSLGEQASWESGLQKDALMMGVVVGDVASQQMRQYLDQLHRWNRTYNLTAIREPDDMRIQHVLDSLSILPLLDRLAAADAVPGEGCRVMDVGSGGGLPGVVIAMQRPAWNVVCVDAVAKKATFIQQMANVLRLPNLQARHARVEQLPILPSRIIVSRAFASLADFVRLAQGHLAPGGRIVAMKGKYPDDEVAELAQAEPGWRIESVETLRVPGLDAQRCALILAPDATQGATAAATATQGPLAPASPSLTRDRASCLPSR